MKKCEGGWTHNICLTCWPAWCVGKGYVVREPTFLRDAEEMQCCICGAPNRDGIFIRGDETIMPFHQRKN